MTNNVIQASFAAGELSPTLYARVDLAKYKIGAARMRNWFVDYRGGASTRAGTEFTGECADTGYGVHLIPFQFSTLNTYVLEFGHLYMRVILDGAYVLEPLYSITGISQANPGVISTGSAHGYATGDTVYFSDIVGMTELNGQTCLVTVLSATTFSIQNLDGVNIDTTGYGAYTSGGNVGRVFTLTTPYTGDDISTLKYTQSADTMTLTHVNYAPRNLTRSAHYSWALTAITMASSIDPPTGLSLDSNATSAGGAGGTGVGWAFTVTAVSQTGEESLPAPVRAQQNVANITAYSGVIHYGWTLSPGAAYYNVYRAPIDYSNIVVAPGSQMGFIGIAYGDLFTDSNITPDYSKQPPQHSDPFAPGQITGWNITNGGTSYGSSTTTAVITDPTGSGANLLPIIVSGACVGFIILNAGRDYTAPVLTLVDSSMAGSGFVGTVDYTAMTGSYPATACYFQQRKVYAASLNRPTTLWMSKPGAFSNFDFANPINDGDSLTITLASVQVNAIKSMVPMPGGLVVFTSGAVWQISSGVSANMPITPSSGVATPQAYNGANDMLPIPINYDILYVQDKGNIVRDLQYNLFANIYTSQDITIFSNHLFRDQTLVDWGFAETPFKIVWAVRADGKLLSLTYIREQELAGWAWHDTQGKFESVAVIRENNSDSVYFAVKRYVNGKWRRYIERMVQRSFPYGVEDSFSLDCALSLPLNYPAADVDISGITGTVTVTASAAVFDSGMVGWKFRAAGGIGTVATFVSATEITVTLSRNIQNYMPDDVVDTQAEGDWSLSEPVTVIRGLSHLEGRTVNAVADGIAYESLTVTNGQITLPVAASKVVVGLKFTAQLQTLRLDVGDPTIQGKRKKINAVTVRQELTTGLKAGVTFDDLLDLKYDDGELYTGDTRMVAPSLYSTDGQTCIQQDKPFPATVLGVIPEISLGDTDPNR